MISEVHNIDCMEFMKNIPDKFFELAIVDPPYGIEDWNKRGTNRNRNKGFDPEITKKWDVKPNELYFNELFRISKSQIIWGANHFIEHLKNTKSMLIWDKRQDGMHFNQFELAWVNGLNDSNIIFRRASWLERNRIHPTQKPIELYGYCLHKYAKPGDKIFDSHMGSQSSRIACYDGGFDYWGCELDPDYFRDGCKRFDNHIKQLKLFTPDYGDKICPNCNRHHSEVGSFCCTACEFGI